MYMTILHQNLSYYMQVRVHHQYFQHFFANHSANTQFYCFNFLQFHVGEQHQISCGDNFYKFYLLLFFDCISITYSHRVWGLGFEGVVGRLYIHTLVKNLRIQVLMMLFLVTIWCCLPACDRDCCYARENAIGELNFLQLASTHQSISSTKV